MEKISRYLIIFKQKLQNLSSMEYLISFIIVINTLCILIESMYFSYVVVIEIEKDDYFTTTDAILNFSSIMIATISGVISGIVTVNILLGLLIALKITPFY
jgi:hypothetical protein